MALQPDYAPLARNESAEVAVVGTGITGLTTAYFFGRAGKSVIVLDGGPIGSGETERTTAHLLRVLGTRYLELEELHGARGAQLAAVSHSAAINAIERIIGEEKIDCDFARVDWR